MLSKYTHSMNEMVYLLSFENQSLQRLNKYELDEGLEHLCMTCSTRLIVSLGHILAAKDEFSTLL